MIENISNLNCNPSPDWSICLSSFFWVSARRLRRRAETQKNSECGKLEKAPKNLPDVESQILIVHNDNVL